MFINLYHQNIFVFIFAIFIIKILFVSFLSAYCPYQLHYLNFSNFFEISQSQVILQEDTFQCFENFQSTFNNTNDFVSCNSSDLDVSFYPISVLPNGTNISPHITINVSVTSFIPFNRLFIQFRCLQAPDLSDKYCHNHNYQIKRWGRMIWPCRDLQLDFEENIDFYNDFMPVRFSYNCFNLFGLSQYELNVTLAPKNCRSTFFFTIPQYLQLEPKMRQFYEGGSDVLEADPKDWSPLIYVDMSVSDGIWIRYQAMPWIILPKHFTITIFKRLDNEKTRFLLTERLTSTENGFKMENVEAGDYLVYFFVNRYDCHINCDKNEDCKVCASTFLNFTVFEDKFSSAWSFKTKFVSLTKTLLIALFVIFFFVTLGLLAVLLYLRLWRPFRLRHQPPDIIQMTERPLILILYTDDCEAHANAVLALANLLTRDVNARVLFDQFNLQFNPCIQPSTWLLNALSEAEFILLIFSECSKRLLKGEKLIPRSHIPDLFNFAVSYVIAKIDKVTSRESKKNLIKKASGFNLRKALNINVKKADQDLSLLQSNKNNAESQLSRFIVSRFSYSPATVVPDFFDCDFFDQLCFPEDLNLLVGRLHGVASTYLKPKKKRGRIDFSANLDELNLAISEFQQSTKENPNWALERFVKVGVSPEGTSASFNDSFLHDRFEQLLPQLDETVLTVEEQAQLFAKYRLENPPNDLEEDIHNNSESQVNENTQNSNFQKFELVGNLDDFCASSSSSQKSLNENR